MFIKIGNRIVNLDNVEMIKLLEEEEEQKIVFHFIDGSISFCSKRKDEKDIEFDIAWEKLNGVWVFSKGEFFL